MRVAHETPKLSAIEWMGCDERNTKVLPVKSIDIEEDLEENYDEEYEEDEYSLGLSSGRRLSISIAFTSVLIVLNLSVKFFYS